MNIRFRYLWALAAFATLADLVTAVLFDTQLDLGFVSAIVFLWVLTRLGVIERYKP